MGSLGEEKTELERVLKNGQISQKLADLIHHFKMNKIQKYYRGRIRNVSPTWENSNMDSYRLKMVKKHFQKIEFLKMSKLENCTHSVILWIELEICSVYDILLQERRI